MTSFRFKKFSVEQGDTAMKVGTDGCLLGAWAKVDKVQQILDIGTGTGLIALMLAQRSLLAKIHAVELDPKAYHQALSNFENSPWNDRLTIWQGAIQNFHTTQKYDLIVSNPPFYPFNDFSLAHAESRRIARSTHCLSYQDLILSVKQLLTPQGKFQLIIPYNLHPKFQILAETNALHLERWCKIQPLPEKAPNRVLASYQLHPVSSIIEEHLTIRLASQPAHCYSVEYKNLLKNFLIIF